MNKTKYKIVPSTEKGFDLQTCFKNKFVNEEGYIKDKDYYFDSYSHFSIHEEMLNVNIFLSI
jgi:protein arginine N-methyltransferase 1